MMGDMPSAPEDADDLADLVNALLASAVHVSHAIERLHELRAMPARPGELMARAQITDAITVLTGARQGLINVADQLSDPLSGP